MKKLEKIEFVINTLAAAVEQFRKEVMQQEEPAEYYEEGPFVTLLDKDKKRLGGNWRDNENIAEEVKSSKVSDLINENDFNILHYLWGEEAKIKDIRYANIAQREFIEHNEHDNRRYYIICKERGWTIDVFKRVATPYEKSFYYPYIP